MQRRSGLLERHRAAMTVLPQLEGESQRWALLAAVVAPKDPRLRTMRTDKKGTP